MNYETQLTGPDPDAVKMFVGQIPKSMSEEELKKMFEEYGPVYQLHVLRDNATGQSKGCCFVTFFTKKAAMDAQNELHNMKTIPGMQRPIQMKLANSEKKSEDRRLFIGMISKSLDESHVQMMFSPFGSIEDCTVLRDPNGKSRGCAFVTYSSWQSAQNAIKSMHHSTTMEGCSSPMVVKFADTHKKKEAEKMQQMQSSMVNSPLGSLGALGLQYLALLQQSASGNSGNFNNMQNMSQNFGQSAAQNFGLSAGQNFGQSTGQNFGQNMGQNTSQNLGNLGGMNMPGAMGSTPLNQLANMQNLTGNNMSNMPGVNSNPLNMSGVNTNSMNMSGVNPNTMNQNGMGSGGTGGMDALSQAYSGLQSYAQLFFNAFNNQQSSTTTAAGKQTEGPDGANLFIYHLPKEFWDHDLMQMFMPFGNVVSAKVFIDKQTNLSKCFGFISYDNPASAQTAIQAMNGFQIGTKRLRVQLKRPKNDSKPY